MVEPKILYEDEELIVLDKPAGISIHADGVSTAPTIAEWLVEKYPELKNVGDVHLRPDGTVLERPGIVHRLDKQTSGVLVVARTQPAFEFLKQQFKNREVRKVYRAFVYGVIKDDRGIIDKPIGSGRGGKAPRSARNPRGVLREAVTAYRVIERTKEATYVEVFPKTGRTHQIRVHFSLIQHPVVCDTQYAPLRPKLFGFSRQALHAFSLTLAHPNGKEMTFSAPLPPDFVAAEEELRKE